MKRRDLFFYVPVAVAGGFFAWLGVRTYNLRFRPRPEAGAPLWREGPRVRVARRGELGVWEARFLTYPLLWGLCGPFSCACPSPLPGGFPWGRSTTSP